MHPARPNIDGLITDLAEPPSAHYHLLLPRELVVDDEPHVARMAPLPGREGLDRRALRHCLRSCRRPPSGPAAMEMTRCEGSAGARVRVRLATGEGERSVVGDRAASNGGRSRRPIRW